MLNISHDSYCAATSYEWQAKSSELVQSNTLHFRVVERGAQQSPAPSPHTSSPACAASGPQLLASHSHSQPTAAAPGLHSTTRTE